MGKLPKGLLAWQKKNGKGKGKGKTKSPKPFMTPMEQMAAMSKMPKGKKKKATAGHKPTVKAGFKPKAIKIPRLGRKKGKK